MNRCFGDGDALYADYHDRDWGRPLTDDPALYERLCLEAFQAGISWLIVLRKREALRAAFAGFDPEAVARFTAARVERMLADASIIRNRAKVEAAIANARAVLSLRESGSSLTELVWSFAPGEGPAPETWADVSAATEESAALAKELKGRGFRFVGPTTAYATMQAAGLVNDHLRSCPVRAEVAAGQAAARARFVRG